MLYHIIPKNTALLMWRDRIPGYRRRSYIATEQSQVAELELQLCRVSYILKLLGITDLLAKTFRQRN
ncbi:hypothetical protein LC608_03015 [Nostoc sp. XA010]|uniref:hypothetical protein n=1 Tax=Nostoc sp. XA010 TaxID=2780407 RepID=UPI001E5A6ED9|nr:hypothetical protein [Nostoc sp. XA010]MCC5655971.1 hypothetical protein [Nostoc sp. XA010]